MQTDPEITPTNRRRRPVDSQASHTIAIQTTVKPKHDPSVARWANGRPPITVRRAVAIAEKRQWEKQRDKLALFVDADAVVDAFRAGKLEGLVTVEQLERGMTTEQRLKCRGSQRRALVRLSAALLYFVAPGVIATHATLAPLFMLSERQTRRVLHELVALELLLAPEPTFEAQRAVHNRRANGYQLAPAVFAAAVAPHVHTRGGGGGAPVCTDRVRAPVLGQKNGQASGTEHTYAPSLAASPGPGGRDAALSTRVPECPATPDPEIEGPNAAAPVEVGPVTPAVTHTLPLRLRTAKVSRLSDAAGEMAQIAAEFEDAGVREYIASLAKSGDS